MDNTTFHAGNVGRPPVDYTCYPLFIEVAMHVTLVHVRVKPATVAGFMAACQANHLVSIREAGNRRFDILQDPQDPTRFILYEAYASAEAAAAHKATAHYLLWRDTVADMMAEPRRGEAMRGLFPAW